MKKMKRKLKAIADILKEKCPQCGEGDAFIKKRGLLKFPEMHEDCPKCDYHFEREPGYFIGAMYISYGLAIFVGLATFVICHNLFPSLSIEWKIFLVVFSIIIFSKKNFKWSRLIYIRIFPW
ncbi:MAG: DUF983 domain-containing protein [Flavobacteriales bacterium]|nr:DUF983 domain-containing protein [Flavobacteriales bacterium]